MGRLLLVRHGQASFSEAVYDRLCPLGEAQSARLGAYWAGVGLKADAVETGPRERHRRTAEVAGEAYVARGGAWPEPVASAAWDEHGVDQIFGRPHLLERAEAVEPRIAALRRSFAEAGPGPERGRAFQRLFEVITYLWSENALDTEGVAPWPAFRDGVRRELMRIADDGRRGRTVVVFTSVGPIAVALGLALGVGDRSALELGWRVRNASVTEMVFSPGRLTLDAFNGLPHLGDPSLWTYR